MLLSVIVAAHNAESTVAEAIQSTLTQVSGFDVEVVVVDDGSTDGTADVVRRIADPRIRLHVMPENVGRAEARNRAVQLSRGGYLAICDADDISLAGRFANHFRSLVVEKSDVCSGQLLDLLPDGNVVEAEYVFARDREDVHVGFSKGKMPIAHPTVAISRAAFDAVNGYDPQLAACEDYDMLLRAWAKGAVFSPSTDALVAYRRRTKTTSWPYWRVSTSYHKAVWNRFCAEQVSGPMSRTDISVHLRAVSRLGPTLISFAQFVAHRTFLLSNRRRSRKMGTAVGRFRTF